MKIFLSSTAYDLMDFRALIVDIMQERSHEVLYHESPTFPAKLGLHTHDQCILAVEECDIVLCILDKRYGGTYNGQFPLKTQIIDIRGFDKEEKKKRYELKIDKSELSITWCELIRAYEKKIPVITFAREQLLNEKETRRRNQFSETFHPAYADKNELFDLIDWITKQNANNWIAPFINIVDFKEKLLKWIEELERTIHPPIDREQIFKDISKVCIIVEGEIDRIFVNNLIDDLKLHNYFVIIPSYGKYRILNYFESTVVQYARIFDHVIVLMDSDTTSLNEIDYIKQEFANRVERSGLENISLYLATPEIESWIAAGLDKDTYIRFGGNINKNLLKEHFVKSNSYNISNILRDDFNFVQAIEINNDLHNFTEKLLDVEKGI